MGFRRFPRTPTGFPSPLWGGARGGGNPYRRGSAIPPSLSLPHKGGGDDLALRLTQELRRRNAFSCTNEPASLPPQPSHSGGNGSIIACFACAVLGQQSDSQHDCDLDALDVSENVVVPEAQHPVALRLEPTGSTLVGRQPFRLAVLTTIDLDNQLCVVVAKIRDVGSDGCLLAELKAVPIEPAQLVPKCALGGALLSPHATSTLAHQVGHAATPQLVTPHPPRSAARWRSRPSPARARAGCSSAARSRRSRRGRPAD